MLSRIVSPLMLLALLGAVVAVPARAEDPGDADLDKAIEAKATANSLQELGQVIDLCERALKRGLGKENADFADKLLASTLYERAEAISQLIFQADPSDPRFVQQYPTLWKAAVNDLEKSLKHDLEQPETHFLLGKLQSLPGGDPKAALKSFDVAIDLSQKDDALRSQALVARGRLQPDADARVADYNEALKLDPQSVDALRARGLELLDQEKYEQGLADLDDALKIEPDDAETHELRGAGLAAMERYDDAIEALDKALDLNPRLASAYIRRGRVRLAQKDAKEALNDFDKALLLQPNSPTALLLRAGAYQQLGEIKRALADVDHLLELRPGLPQALRARAMLLAGEGNFEDAIPDLEKAVEGNPEDPETLLQLGVFYMAVKNAEKAIESFTAAIAAAPDNAAAYQSRGDVYIAIGQHREALADYEEALNRKPENTEVLNNLAWLLATSPDDDLRDGQRAIKLALQACELTDYKKPHILSTLAAGYAESGDFDTAIKWSTKAVELGEARIAEQLKNELASYKAGKPVRERQTGLAGDEEDAEADAEDLPRREDLEGDLEDAVDGPSLR